VTQQPQHLAALESAAQFFGAELRHWRTLRCLSQRALGDLTHDSGALIGKVEKAERRPSLDLARRLDAALDTGGALERRWVQLDRTKRAIRPSGDAGPAIDPPPVHLGLGWSDTPASAVDAVTELWRADMHRRAVIVGAAWSAAALVSPARRWLNDPTDPDISHTGRRRVGRADVEVMWSMAASFAGADHRLGGGYARNTLIQFLDQVVGPLLQGTYDDALGRQLYAAAARLSNLAGFMCFDSGRHGLGQRYFVQALRLTKAAGDQALGAHILTDMSMQAHHLGRSGDARALAAAGHRTATVAGFPSIAARCGALQARAAAAAGDKTGALRAMKRAEQDLARATTEVPAWIRFFTPEQLHAEWMYVSAELGHAGEVQRFAPAVVGAEATMMQRRHVLAASTLAASYLPADRGAGDGRARGDVDQACAVLREALPSATGLTSARGLDSINAVRARLTPYRDRPAVQQVEADFQALVTSAQ